MSSSMVISKADDIQQKVNSISSHIVKENLKGKIPLFVIGSGISMDLKASSDSVEEHKVPSMSKMMEKLYSLYNNIEEHIPDQDKKDIEKRFKVLHLQLDQDRRVDRSNIAGILGYFQEKKYLKNVWSDFNIWLLNNCVNEHLNIGILNAKPSIAHDKIAGLFEKVDAFCITLNFDGLLYRALESKYKKGVHSYVTKEQVKKFFTTEKAPKRLYADIQVRGDIFFVNCDSLWCEEYDTPCENRHEKPILIWQSKEKNLMCEKNKPMKPFISFPGTYKKDKEIRDILSVLWQYFTPKVSCVITIGVSGWWDPVLVAFLSDLARERKIPFIDVNIIPEKSYISKEIVYEKDALKIPANQFMNILDQSIDEAKKKVQNNRENIKYFRDHLGEDKFWDGILNKSEISDFEKKLIRHSSVEITSKFAQLGLKSKWWGVESNNRWHHNRLNHSIGVMKIATFLYEKACNNSNRPERDEEKQFLRIAALLHDIGHLPFSHLIEEVFQELNWRPVGYIESFNHEYYTGEKIRKIFEDEDLSAELEKIGYKIEDVIRLINGEFGISFLDAIINGPVDSDKIDYVFRDAASTNVFPHLIDPKDFLTEIGKEISISPAGLLVLGRSSAEAALTILKQRERLYRDFYLHSGIRLLEKAMKFIIVTYFVYTYNTLEIPEDIKKKFLQENIQFSDFGAIRIAMASAELEKLSEAFRNESDIEMKIIEHMKEKILEGNLIDEKVKNAIEECFSLIERVDNRFKCKEESANRERKFFISEIQQEGFEKIRRDAKTVILRVPGAILIDVLPPFDFFKLKKRKSRSDGTNVSTETLLSQDLNQMIKKYQGRTVEKGQLNIFKIGEESEVERALSLFEKLLGEEKRLDELE